MLRIIRSNHVDALASALAGQLGAFPLSDPMVAEQIVVHHRGMARWLQHRLALSLGAHTNGVHAGICALVEFPFPQSTLSQICCWMQNKPPSASPWSPQALTWTLSEALVHYQNRPEFRTMAHYLRDEPHATSPRLLAISREIAKLFDRYGLYRPAMALHWSGRTTGSWGRTPKIDVSESWQQILWQHVRSTLGPSPIEEIQDAITAQRQGTRPHPDLPQRLSLFGVSSLPPAWLGLLDALSEQVEVSLYLLSPTPHFLGDVDRQPQPGIEKGSDVPVLLEGLGSTHREFDNILSQLNIEAKPCFIDPHLSPNRSALSVLQDDLHQMVRRHPRGSHPPLILGSDDRSIQIHRAAGPIRQVEVLREALLHLLEDDSSLEPRDILILCPDHEEFAPLVSAVFGEKSERGGPPTIPIQVADQGQSASNPVTAAFLQLLALATGRTELSQVLELLSSPVVAPRFQISGADLDQIRTWVEGAGICWGRNATDRAKHGQPPTDLHTWQTGLDRLLLGVAMQDPSRLYQGLSPWDELEGGTTNVLGRFCQFCEVLFQQLDELNAPRPPREWMPAIDRFLSELIQVDSDDEYLAQRTRDAVAEWLDLSEDIALERPLSIQGVSSLLSRVLKRKTSGAGHQTGKATFCSMLPMRAIPFRVVALLGMDEDRFPRSDPVLGFDLIAQHPQPGDRLLSKEDRTLLLESILCAQDHLILTWSHRDPITAQETAPAVPVSEFVSVLENSFTAPNGRTVMECLAQDHPLHPYSSKSFGRNVDGSDRLPWSVDPHLLSGAIALDHEPQPITRLLDESLAPPEVQYAMELGDLIRTLQNPIEALMRNRLQIRLSQAASPMKDREDLELNALAQWKSKYQLLEGLQRSQNDDMLFDLQRALGMLSPGTLGVVDFTAHQRELKPLMAAAENLLQISPETVRVDLALDEYRIQGSIPNLRSKTLLDIQISKGKAKHQLALWIRHLCLTAMFANEDIHSQIIWPNKRQKSGFETICFRPQAVSSEDRRTHACQTLLKLLDLYQESLWNPVPLFMESGLAYARKIHAGKAPNVAMKDAQKGWASDLRSVGLQHAMGSETELSRAVELDRFQAVSMQVFGPMLECAHAGAK